MSIKCNLFRGFSASLLQSAESHDPSEITLIWGSDAQETFMIMINVDFCGNHDKFYFSGLFDE